MKTAAPSEPFTEAGMFVRRSSGLVRSISAFDSFVGNVLIINLVLASSQLILMPWLFPGIDLPLSIPLTGLLVLLPGIVYVLFGLTMPRSGGDYVYISRTLHPLLGMAANFSVVAWNMSWMGAFSYWVSSQGLAGGFYVLGTLFENPTLTGLGDWFARPLVSVFIGTLVVIVTAAILMSGLESALRIQRLLFYVAFAALTLGLVVTLLASNDDFQRAIGAIIDVPAITQAAADSGFAPPAGWNDPGQTFYGTGLNALSLLFMWFINYGAGEVKNVRRSLPLAVLGSLAFSTLYITVLAWSAVKTFGYDFLAVVNQVYYTAPEQYPLAIQPTYQLFASALTDNPVLVALIALAFICWPIAGIIMNHLANSRCMFAWAFDRVLPEKLAEVDERRSSPVYAILLSAIGAELFLIFFAFYGNAATFFGGSLLGYMLGFATTALAGLLFPWTRRDLFLRSPANVRVLGIPLIQIAGLGTLIYFGIVCWAFLTNPAFGLAGLGIVGFAAYWLIGALIYAVSWFVRRRQGLDLGLVYREVPAE